MNRADCRSSGFGCNQSILFQQQKLLLIGHKLPALGIVNPSRQLIGLATHASLQGASDDAQLTSFLTQAGEAIHLRASIREAAKQIQESDDDFLPVVDNGLFFGVLSR